MSHRLTRITIYSRTDGTISGRLSATDVLIVVLVRSSFLSSFCPFYVNFFVSFVFLFFLFFLAFSFDACASRDYHTVFFFLFG